MLAPGGRVVFIVPNRSGLWARRDVTPFGYGRPYSLGQLEALAAPPPLRARAPRRRALRAAVAPQVLAADRPRSGSGSAGASTRGSSPARCSSRRRSRSTPGPSTGAKVAVPRPARGARRPRRTDARAGRRTRPQRRSAAPRRADPGGLRCTAAWRRPSAYCHAPEPLLSPRRFHGRESRPAGKIRTSCPRGAVVRATEGCRCPAQLSLTSGVAGRYATALFEIARDGKLLDEVERDIREIETVHANSADFREILASPGLHPRGAGQGASPRSLPPWASARP